MHSMNNSNEYYEHQDENSNANDNFLDDNTAQDTNSLDLQGQGIEDLEPLLELLFVKMTNLKDLNLADNYIKELPSNIAQYLPKLEVLNVNNNAIEDVKSLIDSLGSMDSLKSIFLNLTEEE